MFSITVAMLFFASLFTFTSCGSISETSQTYEVTVVAKDNSILANAVTTHPVVLVVTASGDTVKSSITENVLLNNKMPFKAEMYKARGARLGIIRKVLPVVKEN